MSTTPEKPAKPTKAQREIQRAAASWHTRLEDIDKTAEFEAPSGGGRHVTSDADRISFPRKLAYGSGAFVNNLLADAIGRMIIILNLGFGMSPALVGLVGALPRVTDALTDPLMGFLSDRTKSRWGRRRPFIFIGAILAGLLYAGLWMLPEGRSETFYFWYFLGGSILFYGAYTVFATPWVALGYELTPDYHERTRLMGVQNIIGQTAYLVTPWLIAFMTNPDWFDSSRNGARVLALVIGGFVMAVGVMPALFLRERGAAVVRPNAPDIGAPPPTEDILATSAVTPARSFGDVMREFGRGFATTLKSKPFLKLCLATFLVFNGFIMIAAFQSYVIIYYVFGGDQEAGGRWIGYTGTLQTAATFLAIWLVTVLATRIGKRRAFFVSTGLAMFGYAVKWLCYDPSRPWLLFIPAPFLAFALGGLFTLMGSMICDVVDLDELETGQRREGMYGSIFWWVVKVGQAAAIFLGGVLLEATGFDVALGGGQSTSTLFFMRLADVTIPFATCALAIWAIYKYPLTEARAHEIRDALEMRRGPAGGEAVTQAA